MHPSRKQAEALLNESEKLNPGKWADHCRVAAQCAEKIASACTGSDNLDPDKAYVLALLHDIGRRFGPSQFGHISDGYHYMQQLGYDEAARICLTHSFPQQDIQSYIGRYDVPPAEVTKLGQHLAALQYDDYDRLIQLCDSVAMAEGVVSINQRLDDVERRYGHFPAEKRAALIRLKAYFEAKMQRNLYSVISDNPALWENAEK
ncbi:HD domain-containing protein [Oscillospiraceae bacterium HV4-5-C5C]|nr:HD domain-containing protein [Oscillospiraceae bacterium HV4-5-C5C]